MNNMADYGFYRESFMGSRIPEAAFGEFMARACDALRRFEGKYSVTGCDTARSMALCAMAEHIYDTTGRRGGVTSAAVGQTSVHYTDRDRGLYDAAATYLEIYRGVSQ